MSQLPDDMARFLFLVPYVAARPAGVPLDELAELLGLTPGATRRLLERVAFVGAPDGSPDEMVDVALQGDRVRVTLPQGFERPPRFRVEETLALLAALAPLRDAGLPTLREDAAALTARLLELASQRASALGTVLTDGVRVASEGLEDPSHLQALEVAVSEGLPVTGEYYTAGRDALSARRLRPVGLLQIRGAWYAVDAGGKVFKVERFRALALAEPTAADAAALEASDVDVDAARARLEEARIDAPAEALVAAEVEVSGVRRPFPTARPPALLRWLRRQGGAARLLAPEPLRRGYEDELEFLSERYADDVERAR
ncbi:MAG: WYL domain-containing protein [Myxococcota bacterium]